MELYIYYRAQPATAAPLERAVAAMQATLAPWCVQTPGFKYRAALPADRGGSPQAVRSPQALHPEPAINLPQPDNRQTDDPRSAIPRQRTDRPQGALQAQQAITYMEVYLGVDAGFEQRLADAVVAFGLPGLTDGPRHAERFEAVTPCA